MQFLPFLFYLISLDIANFFKNKNHFLKINQQSTQHSFVHN